MKQNPTPMNKEKREIRSYPIDNKLVCRRAEDGSTYIEGYAIVFNSDSKILVDWHEDEAFIERIAPDAVTDSTINASDILLTVDHDFKRFLARKRYGQGSMETRIDARGVWFSCKAPNDELGRSVAEHIERGDLFGSSFMFSLDYANCEYGRNADGVLTRTIKKIDQIYDFSIVLNPAYPATTADVSQRSYWIQAGLIKDEPEVDEKYYNELENQLNNF